MRFEDDFSSWECFFTSNFFECAFIVPIEIYLSILAFFGRAEITFVREYWKVEKW